MKTLITLFVAVLSAQAAQASIPSVSNGQCIKGGGEAVATKKYYECIGGKYDGYMTTGPASKAVTPAGAVVENNEIKLVLGAIGQSRNLKCDPITSDNVTLSKGDAFSVTFSCNDKLGRPNVHAITVKGFIVDYGNSLYSASPTNYDIQQYE